MFFAHAFDSPAFGRLVSTVSLLALLPYLILQLTGLGIIVSETSFGAVSAQGAQLIGLLVMTVYVVFTGVRGSAHVAALKDVVVLAVVLALGVMLPQQLFGGIGPMFDRVAQERPDLLTFPARGYSGAAGLLTALVPGSLILITMVTIGARLTMSADDPRAIHRARWMVPVFAGTALLGTWFGGQSLVSLLLLAYAVMAQLVPALVCARYRPGTVAAGAVTLGLAVGEGIIALDLNIGLIALLANLATLTIATRLRRR